MKYYGDIPKEDRELIESLENMELFFSKNETISIAEQAQGYTCIAHDYYHMEMDEEGDRLLKQAEKTCSGYFKNEIWYQMDANPDFTYLVKNLIETLGVKTLQTLGFGK